MEASSTIWPRWPSKPRARPLRVHYSSIEWPLPKKNSFFFKLGTSNWAKDYYTRTAGISFTFESTQNEAGHVPKQDLRTELVDVFNRDWNSPHCKKLK